MLPLSEETEKEKQPENSKEAGQEEDEQETVETPLDEAAEETKENAAPEDTSASNVASFTSNPAANDVASSTSDPACAESEDAPEPSSQESREAAVGPIQEAEDKIIEQGQGEAAQKPNAEKEKFTQMSKNILTGLKNVFQDVQKDIEKIDLEKEAVSGFKEVESSLSSLSKKMSNKRTQMEQRGIVTTVKDDAVVSKDKAVGATKNVIGGIGTVAGEIKKKSAPGTKYVMPPIKKFVATFKNMPPIDELLIITKEGLLIRHFAYSGSTTADKDLLSSMLTVVQNFVSDSFNEKKTELKELRLGDFNILITRGMFIATVVLSSAENLKVLEKPLDNMIADIEQQNVAVFQDWSGDLDQFSGIDDCVDRLVKNEY